MNKPASPTSQRQILKLTQFKYSEAKSKPHSGGRSKPHSGDKSQPQHIPIRTLVEKMSSNPDAFGEIGAFKESIMMARSHSQFHAGRSEMSNFLTPRDSVYKPKPQVFNRYNYENYNGYEYKNPFRPKKYPVDGRIMGVANKNNPSRGTSKNLEIVFCEHKYQDFVEKTNSQVDKQYKEAKKLKRLDGRPRGVSDQNLATRKSSGSGDDLFLTKIKRSLTKGKKKTTLSNYLQQFNTLEKLSNYMEREHKLNEKYLFSTTTQNSRTVLLDIVIHRFEFLKAMKKKARDLVFEILLGVEGVSTYYKINIHEYIKFNQLFVSRDAEPAQLAMFIFAFLFMREEQATKQSVRRSLGLLEGSAKLHNFVEERLSSIVEECEQNSRKIYGKFVSDQILHRTFIDLMLEHR